MIYIGIVGSSKARYITVVESIHAILDRYDPATTTLVSGGAVGVDSHAIRVGKNRGFKVIEYLPERWGVSYLFKRNKLIADKCDKVYSIALELIGNGTKCYHCAKVGLDNNHFKTAGCWTANRCKEHELVVCKC